MLEIIGVSKKYGEKEALHQIDLQLSEGVYALLGPNGAGKSTLMKIITDSLLPTEGKVMWNGESVIEIKNQYREILGYMPQQQGMYDEFTGRLFLNYIGVLKNIPKNRITEEIEKAAAFVNLTEVMDKPIGTYSGGMKQRIMMAQSIMKAPKLLIMDEPTAGLDPIERVRTRNLILELSAESIVLVATHVVSDIESIAKEVIIINKGMIVAKGSPESLIEEYAPQGGLEDVYVKIFGEENQL